MLYVAINEMSVAIACSHSGSSMGGDLNVSCVIRGGGSYSSVCSYSNRIVPSCFRRIAISLSLRCRLRLYRVSAGEMRAR
jgi:hypothetical protein